jgi:tetratricopeptide (TPR) repeat protein
MPKQLQMSMKRWLRSCPIALVLGVALAATSPSHAAKKDRASRATAGLTTFAPLPADHELASVWNEPEFVRRMIGTYGFESESEPRMTPEEQAAYRDKVLPVLRDDPKLAIPVLESLIKPNASAVFDFTLGNVYFQTEALTNAVWHFEAALAKFPDYRRAQKNLAFALVRSGRYAEAIKPLTRTIVLGGGDGRVFGLLGFAFLNQGRAASAEAAYRQALVFEPDNLDFKLGMAKCAVATANYAHALALLEELVGEYPERESLWTLQANLYIQKDQPGQAAVSLEILRRLGKATPPDLFLLGDLYLAQEARDLALAAYQEAVLQTDNRLLPRALRAADVLVSRGAWDEAQTLFRQIREHHGLTLASDDALKLLKLESKVAMATGDGARAIETLEQIIAANPLDGEALLLAGDYYAKHQQPEKAAFRYQTAAGLEAFQADAWVKHAQLLVQSRKYLEALELLKKAQRLKPREHIQRYLEKVELVAGRSAAS